MATNTPKSNANKARCKTKPELPPGYVTIATEPFSAIYWGNKLLGETPLASQRLPAGCIQIEARTEDGRRRRVKIEVEPNTTRVFRFKI